MANNVSSTNLTGLYGSTGNTVSVVTSNVPLVNSSIASKNLTTLYSGNPTIITNNGGGGTGAANIAILDEGILLTSNVASINFVGNGVVANNIGNAVTVTINAVNANYANYAGNVINSAQPNITSVGTLTSLNVTGNVTAGGIDSPTLFNAGVQMQGRDYVQMQYSNGVALPVDPYDVGTGSWFYLDPGGAVFQSNTTGTLQTVTFDNNGNISASGNISTNYYIGNGSLLTGINATGGNSNYANFAGQVVDNTQSNITLVGTLANLTISGDTNSNNIIVADNKVIYASHGAYGPPDSSFTNVRVGLYGTNPAYAIGVETNYSWIQGQDGVKLYTGSNVALVANSNGVTTNKFYADAGVNANVGFGFTGTPNTAMCSSATDEITFYNNTIETLSLYANNNAKFYANLTANYYFGDGGYLSNINGGNVSNVANANYANFAGTAYSVAVANVVGIGNIATTNYDGNASNVLYGNGGFYALPTISNVANANYANFAGTAYSVAGANVSGTVANANYAAYAGNASTLANGTSNISIPTSNGNINFNPAGQANTFIVQTNGATRITPTSAATGAITVDSFGNPLGDVHRINSQRARGNLATPLSVQPNDATMRFLTYGHNGTAYQTNSVASIRALVDSSYTANGANIPMGWQIQVNDTNGGTNNQTKNHSFYSNGNVSFANVIFADGGGLSNIVGANVSGAVGLATYATTANAVAGANVSGTVANATYALNSGNSLVLANGTSNINFTGANGSFLFNQNGISNVATLNNGSFTVYPGSNVNNGLTINGYGSNPVGDMWRIGSFRYRGNIAVPTSVLPGDNTMRLLTAGSNGTALQSNSIASIIAKVDSSYTANGANIPLGWQIQVNDTNGGTNNQVKTHNFYANGTTSLFGNLTVSGGNATFSNISGGASSVIVNGNKTSNSNFNINDAQFIVTMSNVDTTGGYSPFTFQQYAPNNSRFGALFMYRSRGNDYFTQAPVVAGDKVMQYNFIVNSNNTTTSVGEFNSIVTYNDNAGNVGSSIDISALGTGATGYLNGAINLYANVTNANNIVVTGNLTSANANIANLQLVKFQETVINGGTVSGTLTPNSSAGTIYQYTLNGNITINTIANAVAGTSMTLVLTQDSTGGRVLTSSMKFAQGYNILSVTPSAIDVISVFYDGSTYYATLTNGFA